MIVFWDYWPDILKSFWLCQNYILDFLWSCNHDDVRPQTSIADNVFVSRPWILQQWLFFIEDNHRVTIVWRSLKGFQQFADACELHYMWEDKTKVRCFYQWILILW